MLHLFPEAVTWLFSLHRLHPQTPYRKGLQKGEGGGEQVSIQGLGAFKSKTVKACTGYILNKAQY